jgi:hypothetical protein
LASVPVREIAADADGGFHCGHQDTKAPLSIANFEQTRQKATAVIFI